MTTWLQCCVCGQDCIESSEEGLFNEDQCEVCPDCGTYNYIVVDDDTADISTAEMVKDVGQSKCNGACGSTEDWHGSPCRWDCERANMPEKPWT